MQRTTTSPATLELLAPDGRLLHSARFTNSGTQHRMDLDDLPEGAYYVRLTDAMGSSTQRVVKMGR